jgi:hypothetical protein
MSAGSEAISHRSISNLYALPNDNRVLQDMGSDLSNKFWLSAAILVPGLLCAPCVLADETVPGHGRAEPPIEVCEAFPWDVPVEQSFTAESVMRWRRAMQEQDAQQPGKSVPQPVLRPGTVIESHHTEFTTNRHGANGNYMASFRDTSRP